MDDTFDTVTSIHVLVLRNHTLSNGCGYMRLYMYSVLYFSCKSVNTNDQLSKVWYKEQTLNNFLTEREGEFISLTCLRCVV